MKTRQPSASGQTHTPLITDICVFVGFVIVCFFIACHPTFRAINTGLPSLFLALSPWLYAIALLSGALVYSNRKSSTYGTRLLNQYRTIGRHLCFFQIILLIAIMTLQLWHYYHDRMYGINPALLYGLAIISLLVVKGISSSIRRQHQYPVLSGCAFLLIGTKKDTRSFEQSIPVCEKIGLTIIHFNPADHQEPEQQIQQIIESRFVDVAISCDDHRPRLLAHCQQQGIQTWSPAQANAFRLEYADLSIQFLKTSVWQFIFNRLAALLLILITLPVWIITAIAIKLANKGPVFYKQTRSGLYGKHFEMIKFRTMYNDADKRLDEVKAKYGNDMSGPIFKLENDPRIFPVGKIMRKFSIDELPQLINVLLGDMDIVGPRPLPVYETEAFDNIEHRRRLSITPGLTCYWQTEGRSDITDFDELVQLDYKYIERYGFWTDILLILKTIPAVLFARGAK